jgi:hypothetical protein
MNFHPRLGILAGTIAMGLVSTHILWTRASQHTKSTHVGAQHGKRPSFPQITCFARLQDYLFHFFLAFLILFLLLGFLAFWLFGDRMDQFEDPQRALHTQFKMLVGTTCPVVATHLRP